MQPKYLKDALAVLELYRTSGPELYWKEAKAAMLTRRDKAAFGTAHAQMSAPLDGLEGGGEKKCACAWHLLRIRAGVLLLLPPPGAAIALRCVAPRKSKQFSVCGWALDPTRWATRRACLAPFRPGP